MSREKSLPNSIGILFTSMYFTFETYLKVPKYLKEQLQNQENETLILMAIGE